MRKPLRQIHYLRNCTIALQVSVVIAICGGRWRRWRSIAFRRVRGRDNEPHHREPKSHFNAGSIREGQIAAGLANFKADMRAIFMKLDDRFERGIPTHCAGMRAYGKLPIGEKLKSRQQPGQNFH